MELTFVKWTLRVGLCVTLVCATTLLLGCRAHTGKIHGTDLTGIRLGMSKQEVVGVLGKPQNASANDAFETYRYFEDRGMYRLVYHEFVFVDDKLKLYGIGNDPTFRLKVQSIPSSH